MSDKSKIEWTDATWNPIRGCSKVSEGCRNCYAERVAARFAGEGMPYEGLAEMTQHGPRWTGAIRLVPEVLDKPLRWKKTRRIFVNSMSDLFHPDVPLDFLDRIFAVMSLASHHTFMILTKRPERMREYITYRAAKNFSHLKHVVWPLPNVWLGVSVENQKAADERISLLLQTPAAVRFLSCEPLLGPVDLSKWLPWDLFRRNMDMYEPNPNYRGIDWIIVGGESGPNARPMHPDWVRSIRDQCVAAEVPFFFKQWGEWAQIHELRCNEPGIKGKLWYNFDPDTSVCRIGKKAAGRELDGRTWDEMPGVIK